MMRVKYCKLCKKDFPVMFRIQYNSTKEWVCLHLQLVKIGLLGYIIKATIQRKTIHITDMEGLGKSDV